MVKWAGGLIVFYGAAHTLGGLAAEGAARHAGTWFGGEMWGEELANMSPAMSAYWLTVNSFGPPLILIGLTVLWLNRRGITPPQFLAWSMAAWVLVGTVIAGPGVGQDVILLAACGLLLAAHRRAKHTDPLAPEDAPTVAENAQRLACVKPAPTAGDSLGSCPGIAPARSGPHPPRERSRRAGWDPSGRS
ncbi:hypothetical protein GCM10029963_76210 [Micromonospora andamanensis]|uniref:Uncharacterized protein n=1 Tax=Micromonospora andamanensis TaxID=1287068 RepID=A0ABQ4I216_9ACTN|nr:hypothetical protein Van01_51730 [Micromonospora andamanensis]GIJ42550.1 hypothetical protein Vwe01_58750 [Micromonospora andamanensis]